MIRKIFINRRWLVIFFALLFIMSFENAFAWDKRDKAHREVTVRRERYDYHNGRFYRPGWFGFQFYIGTPSIGAVVTSLPFGHRAVKVRGVPYYTYADVYYRPCTTGYVVVPAPVEAPEVVYMSSVNQPQVSDRETVTINVPGRSGSSIAITLVRFSNGFVGPQGEFYSTLPTIEQLRVRYGR